MTGVLLFVNENCKRELYKNEKEENTMAAITKPTEQAFVLSNHMSEKFLKQDNSQFRNIMAKFERYTKKSHSISKKK